MVRDCPGDSCRRCARWLPASAPPTLPSKRLAEYGAKVVVGRTAGCAEQQVADHQAPFGAARAAVEDQVHLAGAGRPRAGQQIRPGEAGRRRQHVQPDERPRVFVGLHAQRRGQGPAPQRQTQQRGRADHRRAHRRGRRARQAAEVALGHDRRPQGRQQARRSSQLEAGQAFDDQGGGNPRRGGLAVLRQAQEQLAGLLQITHHQGVEARVEGDAIARRQRFGRGRRRCVPVRFARPPSRGSARSATRRAAAASKCPRLPAALSTGSPSAQHYSSIFLRAPLARPGA